MTLTFGHVCIAIVYVLFLESFDVRTKRTAYSKTVSRLVRTELKTLLMYILGGGARWTVSRQALKTIRVGTGESEKCDISTAWIGPIFSGRDSVGLDYKLT
jgi:hypothetical protein